MYNYENWESMTKSSTISFSGITLTLPEQAQGASKLFELSNSSSWHILQREITETEFKLSTSNTISPIFAINTLLFLFLFFLCFSNFECYYTSLLVSPWVMDSIYKRNKCEVPKLPLSALCVAVIFSFFLEKKKKKTSLGFYILTLIIFFS